MWECFDDKIYGSFRNACDVKDLLEGDEECEGTMKKHHFGIHHINW